MNIIITSSREKFKSDLNIDANIKYVHFNELTQELMNWANAYIGYAIPFDLNIDHIKWIHCLGAGVDMIVGPNLNENTIVTRTIGDMDMKISEYVISRILLESQKIEAYKKASEKSKWIRETQPITLKNQKVLILGTGAIGSKIGETLSYFQMNVYGFARSIKAINGYKEVNNDLHLLLKNKYDWIVNILPLNDSTYHLMNKDFFDRLDNTNLINVGRGKTIDTDDLLYAIEKGNINKAYLDVFENEPLKDNRIWSNKKIVATPHISGITNIDDTINLIRENYNYIVNKQYNLLKNIY